MLVFEERGNLENPEKNLSLRAEQRTSNKLNPHMTPGPGIEPGTHWWEASAFTTASSLLNYAQNYDSMMHDVSSKHVSPSYFEMEEVSWQQKCFTGMNSG